MSNELDEKFVADHTGGEGVPAAEVAEPVSGAGGAIKKKKADVKKSVDAKADKVDGTTPGQGAVKEDAEIADAEMVEEVIEFEESIASMFEGMDLSEEFTSKVTLVFEAAVNEAAQAKSAIAIAEATEALEVEMKEGVDTAVEKIVENLDSYLDYVVEEWMKENELAIETGVKVEMAESLMAGLKGLFEEHNIEVDEDTVDVVVGLEEEVVELKANANEVINENVDLKKQIAALSAGRVFDEMTEDLTITQRERLKVLSEKLDVQDIAEYKTDLTTLKESFFASKKIVAEEVEEEQEIITEDTSVRQPVSDFSSINALVESLNARQQ
jgi:hypothetical protein|tara:strand:+ start:1660 stop:2640 length:981 start_codon:yes stop_codon:yes gene_type:complete